VALLDFLFGLLDFYEALPPQWRLLCLGWLVLSFAVAYLPNASPWVGAIVLVIGLLLLPGILEKRYDRLVAARRTKDAKF
jgi:putative Mn2+ efflux pump MntP